MSTSAPSVLPSSRVLLAKAQANQRMCVAFVQKLPAETPVQLDAAPSQQDAAFLLKAAHIDAHARLTSAHAAVEYWSAQH